MSSAIQQRKLEYFFSVLDLNGNGILQPDDFTIVGDRISDLIGLPKKSKKRLHLKVRSYRLFIQILTDIEKEKTELNKSEWLSFFTELEVEHSQKYISRTVSYLFSIFDQNGDGLITEDEYLDMFKAYDLNLEHVAMGFKLLDLNGDAQLSKEELLSAFHDFFLSTDPDAPGNWIFGDWQTESVTA